MKLLSLLVFGLGMSLSVSAADICFKTYQVDAASGRIQIVNLSNQKTLALSLATARCMCVENLVVESIENFIKNLNSFSLGEKSVCLKDAFLNGARISSASGIYLK